MTEDKQQFNTMFGDNNDAGVCGPDGCNITEHQKQSADKKKQTN
jgi:hypothetical protein